MIISLIANVAAALRSPLSALRPERDAERRPRKAESGKRTIPSVEVLEDRCLLSSTTTIPLPTQIPLVIALPDVLAATSPKGNPTVVFLGDSISYQYAYGTGAPVWNSVMAPLGMANYGVSGQTTQSLLFQMAQGQLIGINPSVVVLDIGGNDLLQGDSPLATAAGVLADVAAIHQYLPDSQVLVLGVFPGKQSPTDPYRTERQQTNQLVSQMLAGDSHATYLDLGPIFLQPDGTISTGTMFDYIHPTQQGYVNLTNVLLPIIEQAVLPSSSPIPTLPGIPDISSISSIALASLIPTNNAALPTMSITPVSTTSPLPMTP